MKKIVVILFLLVLISSVLSAQVMMKGLKAGLNLANITGDDAGSNNAMKIGFAFGGFLTYGINEQICLQPEILYTMKGFQDKDESDYKMNLNYLEIPILVKYSFDPINVFVGPQFAFLMSAKATDGNNDVDVKDDLKGTEFGLILGAGMNLGQIMIDARYNMGLSKIDDMDDAKVYNSVISIMVGFGF